MKKTLRISGILVAVSAAALGGGLWFVLCEGYRPTVQDATRFLWGLYALEAACGLIWILVLLGRGDRDAYTFAYIGSQARDWGFLGTLGGMMIMFVALGMSVKAGQAGAIKQTIAGLSTAVVTSVIGLSVAKVCKHFEYLSQRQHEETVPHESAEA